MRRLDGAGVLRRMMMLRGKLGVLLGAPVARRRKPLSGQR
jgi:hypothetical protein